MTRIFSDLPKPVMQALLEQEGFELSDEKKADIKLYSAQLPPAPYRLGEILDSIHSHSSNIVLSGIEFDLSAGIAKKGRRKTSLTEKEAEILRLLAFAGKPVSKEELLKQIWQYASDATTNTVETHIYRLRQKLTENFGIEVIVSTTDGKAGSYSVKK